MADIEIAIRAKNEASAAINQTSADLAGLANTASDTAASLNAVSVKPVDFTATDSVTPVLDTVQANVDAASLEVEPLDILATDNASSVMDSVVAKANALTVDIEPINIEVADNWRAPIDELNARLDETKANAEATSQQLSRLESPRPVNLTAKDTATPAVNNVKNALSGLDGVAGTAAKAMGGLDAAMALGGAAVGIAGVVQLTQAIWDLGAAGASFAELRDASEALGASFGVNARAMLTEMRKAADGTIADSALMLAANRAIVTGVTKNADVMAQLLEDARARADAFGLSSTDAFNTLVTGIGNAAPRMLKQLGYTIDLSAANEAYARSIGVATDALNEQQQRQAILNAVLAQSGKIPSVDSAADSFERLDASLKNMKDALGILFGPAVAAVAQALADAANAANEIVKGASSDLAGGAIVASEQIGILQARVQQLNADRALMTQGDTADRKADTSNIDAQIASAQQAASAFELLRTTSDLANQAMAAGAPNAGEYAAKVNAITDSAAQNKTLTTEQIAELANLNSELQSAVVGLNAASGAEAGLSGSIASTNPAIAEQTSRLQGLWVAASGALGASAAFAQFNSGAAELNRVLKENEKLNSLGLPVPPPSFATGTFFAEQQKEIDDLRKKAQEPITLEIAVKGVSDAAAQKAYNDAIKATGDVGAATEAARNTSAEVTDEVNRQVAAWQANGASITDITSFLLPSMRSQLSSATDGVSEMVKQFNEVKDKVSGVIQEAQKLPSFKAGDLFNSDELAAKGLSFDAQISINQAANGGIRPDDVNENARRLMAIAKEGIADQSWLDEFKREVPAVFAELENSPDIRGSALRILQEFENGMRPELLDRGMIKDRVKQMIIGDQNAAAIAEEIAQEIAQEMGISLTQAMSATNSALGLGTGEGTTADVTAPDLTDAGTTTGESFRAGIVAGFDAGGMTGQIIAKIDAEFSNPKNIDALKKSGGTVGAVWGTGFLNTVGTNIPPGLYDVLVSGLVPLIVAALGSRQTQTGAQP